MIYNVDLRFIVDLEFQVFSVHKPHEFLLLALDLHLECLIKLRIERARLFARLVRLNWLLQLKNDENLRLFRDLKCYWDLLRVDMETRI